MQVVLLKWHTWYVMLFMIFDNRESTRGKGQMLMTQQVTQQQVNTVISMISCLAIGKGGAIASAVLVSLSLLGAFVNQCRLSGKLMTLDIMDPLTFAGLLIGAMLPYSFSAFTVASVGKAALAMVAEVRRQFKEIPGLMEGTARPEYEKCVSISTKASLKEMIPPALLVLLSPMACGMLFGVGALAGMLAGAIVSGAQMAISASNSGGAWDNAKKHIEGGVLGGKGSSAHLSAVVGDTGMSMRF